MMGPCCRRDLATEEERDSPGKAWGRRGRFRKTAEDLVVLPGVLDVQATSLVIYEVEGELVYADADGLTPTASATSESTAAWFR
jgi:hypothetical protein